MRRGSSRNRLISHLCQSVLDPDSAFHERIETQLALIDNYLEYIPLYTMTLDSFHRSSTKSPYIYRADPHASPEDKFRLLLEKIHIAVHKAPETLYSLINDAYADLPNLINETPTHPVPSTTLEESFHQAVAHLNNHIIDPTHASTPHDHSKTNSLVDEFKHLPKELEVIRQGCNEIAKATVKGMKDTAKQLTSHQELWRYRPKEKQSSGLLHHLFPIKESEEGKKEEKENHVMDDHLRQTIEYQSTRLGDLLEWIKLYRTIVTSQSAYFHADSPKAESQKQVLKNYIHIYKSEVQKITEGLTSILLAQGLHDHWIRRMNMETISQNLHLSHLPGYTSTPDTILKSIADTMQQVKTMIDPVEESVRYATLELSFPSCLSTLRALRSPRTPLEFPNTYAQTRLTGYLMALVRVYAQDMDKGAHGVSPVLWSQKSIHWLSLVRQEIQTYTEMEFYSREKTRKRVLRAIIILEKNLIDASNSPGVVSSWNGPDKPTSSPFSSSSFSISQKKGKEHGPPPPRNIQAIHGSRVQLTQLIKEYLLSIPLQPSFWHKCVTREIRV